MKLVNYQIKKSGKSSFGLYTANGVVDLHGRVDEQGFDIKTVLGTRVLEALSRFELEAPDFQPDELIFRPVIERPGKIFCVGMNYSEKRQEFGETSRAPTLFVRFADSQTGHGCPILKPAITEEFDYEGELAVVIGRSGLRISPDDALDYVAGYSCYMDGSVRDWQHTWFTAGKNWRQTGSFGPWLVTRDEIPDPHDLTIRTYLNGTMVQDDNTKSMIHKIPELIAHISSFSALSPGDVIITGSPGGVGKKRNPPLFLKEGDLVEVEIEKIGRLSNTIMVDAMAA